MSEPERIDAAAEQFEPRRRPTQQRSKLRFQLLLQAARDELVSVGFESFTCEQVAARAQVPIGSLYQYFANKYVIVCELDREDLADVKTALHDFGKRIPSLNWAELLNAFVDHLAQLWLEDPSRRAVWHAMQSTPMTRAMAADHERALANEVRGLLGPLTPGAQLEQREHIAQVLVHTVYSMLNFSIRDGQSHPDAVEQLKLMLVAYLEAAEAQAARIRG